MCDLWCAQWIWSPESGVFCKTSVAQMIEAAKSGVVLKRPFCMSFGKTPYTEMLSPIAARVRMEIWPRPSLSRTPLRRRFTRLSLSLSLSESLLMTWQAGTSPPQHLPLGEKYYLPSLFSIRSVLGKRVCFNSYWITQQELPYLVNLWWRN